MKRLKITILGVVGVLLLVFTSEALAQSYYFSLDKETVNVYWNQDGSQSIDYVFVFTNNSSAPPMEYIDVGMPYRSVFEVQSIKADVNGKPDTSISTSDYEGTGEGFSVVLGRNAIQPGKTGQVHIYIGVVKQVLYTDSSDSNYASAVFSPSYFGSKYVYGNTNLTVSFHLPPGVKPDEPRWHKSPSGWASEPSTSLDSQGRVTYTWSNALAQGDKEYQFGASFPKQYVPASAILKPNISQSLGVSSDTLITCLFLGGFGIFFALITIVSMNAAQKRKLQYLPPKIAIEGHGIKRGLTAIEAAILLEQPMDKILTMVLFATIKKGAATVLSRDPLKLQVTRPIPDDLQPYEKQFLEAFSESRKATQRRALQTMMVDLVQGVSRKMKGFSRRETIAYYRDIVKRAWTQVEAADTPEVKSQKFDEVMEWTMLDKDYDDRTRRVFRTGPVFVPVWWPRYDPTFGRGGTIHPVSPTAGGGGSFSLPHLPGSDFAASMVHGVQDFSSNVIGNLTDFTSGVTNKTNPIPVSRSSGGRSGGGGGGCACACACAGCACACAGGGR